MLADPALLQTAELLETVTDWDPSTLFRVVDVLGVVANAFLGGILARALRFDIVGFLVLGILSGLGGGMLRDVLLQQGFPVALTDPLYLTGALGAALLAFLVPMRGRFTTRFLDVADVLALGCWSATGCLKALAVGLGFLPSVLLGVLTAVGGGMVRDVVVGRTPRIFGGNPLDATVALVGSVLAGICFHLHHPQVGMGVAILVVAVLGLLARRKGWALPLAPEWDIGSHVGKLRHTLKPRPIWKRRRSTKGPAGA